MRCIRRAVQPGPHFIYTLRQLRVKGINHLDLTIDGNHLTGSGDKSEKFTLAGNGKPRCPACGKFQSNHDFASRVSRTLGSFQVL
jgi:hypothetical protein